MKNATPHAGQQAERPPIDSSETRRSKADAEQEDGVLDSLGKAVTDPMKSGAEEEEPRSDGTTPEAPGP